MIKNIKADEEYTGHTLILLELSLKRQNCKIRTLKATSFYMRKEKVHPKKSSKHTYEI